MSPAHIQTIHTLSTLSVTDISGKRVISIVKKHTEDAAHNPGSEEILITEIYFLSPENAAGEDVIKMIRYQK